ncbi:uncharacterized protein LOC108458587 [Gossypium arboreum]|uniref:uncharacterized protein LOC108458587 n=1 Tax=Gossypium arboreum TaxID=29729 RepID=UPI000818F2EC|nr:uncharacterized protein LOC108458587 [Gossypium arboreum]
MAQKYVRKGYEAYVAYIFDSKVLESKLELVLTVCDFTDVFPEELPRLSRVREVIGNISDIDSSVKNGTYRVEELKAQLQELIHRGFVYPIFSPQVSAKLYQLKVLSTEALVLVQQESGKANVVIDTLSRKSLFALRVLNMLLTLINDGSILAKLKARSMFLQHICDAQKSDAKLIAKWEQIESKPGSDFHVNSYSSLYFENMICVLRNSDVVVASLLQPVMIPEWNWERVLIDFVLGLPLSLRKKDVVWLIVDHLTKFTHFIPVRTDCSLEKLAELYVYEIVRLHGVPVSIIFDRDPRFTS